MHRGTRLSGWLRHWRYTTTIMTQLKIQSKLAKVQRSVHKMTHLFSVVAIGMTEAIFFNGDVSVKPVPRYLFFYLDLKCYIDAIYLATVSEIYLITGGSNITTLSSATNAKLEYDRLAKRIVYFTDDDNTLYTMKLDGTNKTVISSGIQMDAFSIDYQSRFIYYTSEVDGSIKGFPMTNSSIISELITGQGNVKDLDFDSVFR